MANWSNNFPSWGDAGEQPSSGKNYQGGDQVNEKHFDYLWDQLNKQFDEVLSHTLQDDGSVNIDNGSTALPFTQDAGAETAADMAVSSSPTAGTEQSYTFDVDGTSIAKVYAEADGSGGIQNARFELPSHNLRIATGQALEDGGGTNRFQFNAGDTAIMDEAGNRAIRLRDGNYYRIEARANRPFQINDQEQNAVGVQYDTGASGGLLRALNAGMTVEGDVFRSSGPTAIEMAADDGNGYVIFQGYDRAASSFREIRYKGSLHNFAINGADLRLATGQAIEDGGGNTRIRILADETFIDDDSGNRRARFRDGDTSFLYAETNSDMAMWDSEYSQEAYTYTTGNPGSLKLTNAELKVPIDGQVIRLDADNNPRDGVYFEENGTAKWTLRYLNEGFAIVDEQNNTDKYELRVGSHHVFRGGDIRQAAAANSFHNTNVTNPANQDNSGQRGMSWPDQGDGRNPVLSCNTAGEIYAIDDAGNVTTLT